MDALVARLILFQHISELFIRDTVQFHELIRPLEMTEIFSFRRSELPPFAVCDEGLSAVHRQHHEKIPHIPSGECTDHQTLCQFHSETSVTVG